MRKFLLIVSALLFAPLSAVADAAPPPQPQQLKALLDSDWQWTMRHQPEYATYVGDKRYNDRLSDTSLAASLAANAHQRDMLEQARRIDRNGLSVQERISLDLFLYEKTKAVEAAQFYEYMPQPITHLDGIHIALPQLVAQTPFENAKDYHNYLARLRGLPKYIDGIIGQMRKGMETGWVAPAVTVQLIPDQLKEFVAKLEEGPVAAPFKNIPASIPKSTRERLAQEGEKVLRQRVAPAFVKLEAFVREQYLPKCRATIAATALPASPAYYAHAVRHSTTTAMTPQEIHELGLREVARIQGELRAVMKQVDFKGSLADFAKFLNTDPRFYFTKPEDLLEAYRDILKRAVAGLPRLFAELPRVPVDVKAMPDVGAENQTAGYYEAGAPDGSRPGYFVANLSKLHARPKWGMETLTLHEAVPGHHLQIARAQELKNIPEFRRFGWYIAFGEGWALYAESLGGELGFFSDPYSKAGHLNAELFRAARLVVDTGMHALGWSREKAIDYLNANTTNPPHDNRVEIDRYIMWPGQALGYKIGQLKIKELREKARAALGPKFDLRRFNNALIDNGPLPLAELETQIERWIGEQLPPKP
ncbi:MAG TPA: DUF885 domain-containing protein [Paucimonas sp.]|nr:DUF885 domain-containing protein [Paucimonas sp.]